MAVFTRLSQGGVVQNSMEDSGNVVLCVDAEQPSTFKSNFVYLGLKEVVRMLLGSVGRLVAYNWYCRLELLKKDGHFHCVCGGVLKGARLLLSLYPFLSLEFRDPNHPRPGAKVSSLLSAWNHAIK